MKYKLILFTTKKSILIIFCVFLILIALFKVYDHDTVLGNDINSRLQWIKDLLSANNHRAYYGLTVLVVSVLFVIGLLFNCYYCAFCVTLLFCEVTRKIIDNVLNTDYKEVYTAKLYLRIGLWTLVTVISTWFTYDLYFMRKNKEADKTAKVFRDQVQIVLDEIDSRS